MSSFRGGWLGAVVVDSGLVYLLCCQRLRARDTIRGDFHGEHGLKHWLVRFMHLPSGWVEFGDAPLGLGRATGDPRTFAVDTSLLEGLVADI